MAPLSLRCVPDSELSTGRLSGPLSNPPARGCPPLLFPEGSGAVQPAVAGPPLEGLKRSVQEKLQVRFQEDGPHFQKGPSTGRQLPGSRRRPPEGRVATGSYPDAPAGREGRGRSLTCRVGPGEGWLTSLVPDGGRAVEGPAPLEASVSLSQNCQVGREVREGCLGRPTDTRKREPAQPLLPPSRHLPLAQLPAPLVDLGWWLLWGSSETRL